MSIHINAQAGDFAETILLPGDPQRAKFIAENFIDDAKQVTDVRGILGFTGTYQGKPVSVMGTGMGIPSCSIYATELIRDYGVKELIRVGSCGTVLENANLGDVVIAMGASTDSSANRQRFKGYDFAAIADYGLLQRAVNAAANRQCEVEVGNIYSADLFYSPEPEMFDVMAKLNILGVEMEAAGLYGVAAEMGAKALTICTVSDHIKTGAAMTSEERLLSFEKMIYIALDAVIAK